jgi:AcrR family transcriptional regulator
MPHKTKDKILISAKKLIGDKGYNNTKVIDITKDAGIAKGSFYTYFQTKEDVFVELLENMFDEYKKTFDEIEYNNSLKKDVERFVENVYKSAVLDKEGIKILSNMFMSVELSEKIILIRNKFMRGTEDHLKRLFESNKEEMSEEVVGKLSYLSPAMEKLIRVYVMSTLLIDPECGPLDSCTRKDLLSDEVATHKVFLAEIIYKALKK